VTSDHGHLRIWAMSARSRRFPAYLLLCGSLLLAFVAAGCLGHESGIDPNIKVVGEPATGPPPPATAKKSKKGRPPVPSIWERRREVGKVARD